MTPAALLPLCLLTAAPADARTPTQQITVDVRGPIALVEVTRMLTREDAHPGGEWLFDVALPEDAALVEASVRDEAGHGAAAKGWVALPPAEDITRAAATYADRLRARGFEPSREPQDDSTTYRFRVARAGGDARAPLSVRYRFSLLPSLKDGRWRLRFPASPERLPLPADVRVTAAGTTDLQIAGAPARRASTRVPARSGWEISWLTAGPRAVGAGPTIVGTLATSNPRDRDTTLASAIEVRPGRPVAPPANVLLLIDRSRSVGLAGAAAERDLTHKLLEALPPSTHFDALFFDRAAVRLFPMPRPATREAMNAIDAELLPDRMRNGTDLPGALRAAGDLLRREATAYAPRVLLAIVTDGALPDGRDATSAALDRALGVVPGVDVQVAAFVVRPVDDENAPAPAVQALRGLAAARGGVARELRANQFGEVLPPALAALGAGGDVAEVKLAGTRESFPLATSLAPGEGHAALLTPPAAQRGASALVGLARGAELRAVARKVTVPSSWLSSLRPGAPTAHALVTETLIALVEVALPHVISCETTVKGRLDRDVVRNTLALAYLPRARACYLSRSGATPAERDLAGRVKLDIDLARGEVGRVVVESSTLASPSVEACLRQGALALDVPRALRNDFPVTARLNLVFRPRTPDKATTAAERALGDQIDLVIEDLHRAQAPAVTESPAGDRSMIPTR